MISRDLATPVFKEKGGVPPPVTPAPLIWGSGDGGIKS